MATIGRIDRFASPGHLVGYLGLDPRSRHPASARRSTATSQEQRSETARHVLCEAAHATMRPPGRYARSGQRVRTRRNAHARARDVGVPET
jgi:transposase